MATEATAPGPQPSAMEITDDRSRIDQDLVAMRQRAMLKNASLMSTSSIQTAITATSETSFQSANIEVTCLPKERSVKFDNTVKVRIFRSHREWTEETKADYWCPRMTNKELCQAIFAVNDAYDSVRSSEEIQEVTEASTPLPECPPYMDLHDWIMQSFNISLAIAAKAEMDVIDSIIKDPSSFSQFFNHTSCDGQSFRGLERYLCPTYCERRKQGIRDSRKLVTQMSLDNCSPEDIAEKYSKITQHTRILSRLRGQADHLAGDIESVVQKQPLESSTTR